MKERSRTWLVWVLLIFLIGVMAFGSYYINTVQKERVAQTQTRNDDKTRAIKAARNELQAASIETKGISDKKIGAVMQAAKSDNVSIVEYVKAHRTALDE
ncbi:hypothetical protein JK159_05225 [Weissella minor]|uniref:hypothetical protein n=1 Tax=Weissella minor TaxID=1620 RepID=UPI001BAEB6CD|nr:hypothetical protein [Weissella minor]MBS0949767.1 hypothetical protein [Weissella minor]